MAKSCWRKTMVSLPLVFAATKQRWVWNWKQTMAQFYTCLSWRKGRTEYPTILAACRFTRATHSQVRMKQKEHVTLCTKIECFLFLIFLHLHWMLETNTVYLTPLLQSISTRCKENHPCGNFIFRPPENPVLKLFLSSCLSGDDPEYLITGTHAYPSGPGKHAINWSLRLGCSSVISVFVPVPPQPPSGVALTADTKIHRNPSEGGVHSVALALPPSQAR